MNCLEKLIDCKDWNSRVFVIAYHCVRFTWTCCSISKNTSVISSRDWRNQSLAGIFINFFLSRVLKDFIKNISLFFRTMQHIRSRSLVFRSYLNSIKHNDKVILDTKNVHFLVLKLPFIHWSNSNGYQHILIWSLKTFIIEFLSSFWF